MSGMEATIPKMQVSPTQLSVALRAKLKLGADCTTQLTLSVNITGSESD